MGRSKIKPNHFRVAANTQDWFGFTLKRGHVFGLFVPCGANAGACYVTGGEPDETRRNAIKAYKRLDGNRNVYRWKTVAVCIDSELGKMLLDALDASPYDGVELPPEQTQPPTMWKPARHAKGVFYDSTPWKPGFPTFRERRPDAKPQERKIREVEYTPSHTDPKTIEASATTASIWGSARAAYNARREELREKYDRSHARFLQMQAANG